ncbi:MAG: ferrous iron transport protein B [Alphaproteobacteria bacterium]|nr:ferrous iron transport protein B [Alphaproteobacteria bacterium]
MTTLQRLPIGKSAQILSIDGDKILRQHLLDMGLLPGTCVTVKKLAPMGDPIEILVRGYDLTLRKSEAALIKIKNLSTPEEDINTPVETASSNNECFHPGLGEGGKFHDEDTEQPLPDDTTLTFALVGNQNCGKTTLFNQLTGSKQHVGNFPGVTVSSKTGPIRGYPNTLITDLPGIYSISPYSSEEIVTRNFILDKKPHAIINIVDATNLERNLYLTTQLLELNIPMVLAINMIDELHKNSGSILVNKLENLLGIPVVPISALKNDGINELIEHAIHIAKYQEKPLPFDFCDKDGTNAALHRCKHAISHLIVDHAEKYSIPTLFATSKLVENDSLIIKKLQLDKNEITTIDKIIQQMEKESGVDRYVAMAQMRYAFIRNICNQTLKAPRESIEYLRSQKLDKILTGKYTALPIFLCIMALIFWLTFGVIGSYLQELLQSGIDFIASQTNVFLTKLHINHSLYHLINDGIFLGVGSVISFLPLIVVLFFFLSLLEDSGYIARIAFFMDAILRKIGLSGRSVVSLLVGFGCTVPAIMSTRTIPSERDRKMTILLSPFMSCSAKLPIYVFFIAAFFPKHTALVLTLLYIFGIFVGTIFAIILKYTVFKGNVVPFVMELPNYRIPGLKNTFQLLWEKAKDFLQKAFTIILVATVLIWFLQSFNSHFILTDNPEKCILARISGFFAPIFKPLGFGDWRSTSALFTGLIAKESVVSTLTILLGGAENISSYLSPLNAITMLVFCLLYTPCVASLVAINRELGIKYTIFAILGQSSIAWIAAFIVKHICSMFGII